MNIKGSLRSAILFLIVTSHSLGLEPVRVAPDKSTFMFEKSGQPFRVWGVNYDHDSIGQGRLLEDYWGAEWETVRSDFREIKDLGANVVRIHLQLGKFMTSPEKPDEKALAKLRALLELSEQLGLYLDITGLGCYHKAETPAWYDALPEKERWEVQARFWTAIASTGRDSPAVFCYDLMNEPVIDGKKYEGWLTGELGGKHFVQRLTLEKGNRSSVEIAKAWVEKLTTAIRQTDPGHLITVGVIPWSIVWPGAKPIFYAPEVSGFFDFVSIHVYPKKGELEKTLEGIKPYQIGKPLVIEETFPLNCGMREMNDFLDRTRSQTAGYMSFYWGKTVSDYERETGLVPALMRDWLRFFKEKSTSMK